MPDPKIEQFKKVLKLDPNDETLWFGLGKAYMAEENWPEAISALESCIHVKPTYSAAFCLEVIDFSGFVGSFERGD